MVIGIKTIKKDDGYMARVTTQFTGIIMYRQDYRERDLLVKMLTDKIGPAMFL